jgi:6-pyruvoyltetrahydropterin/6-carboxytetrahydropterin synthase
MHTVLELAKENFKFSSGHFTIFSATERENLHGHNFTLAVEIQCAVGTDGMTFDYGLAKRAIERYCRNLNEYFLLPANSPHLRIVEEAGRVDAHFNGEVIPFLARDVKILPLRNITVEELARHAAAALGEELGVNPAYRVSSLRAKISSGPGQGAWSEWRRMLATPEL